MKTYRGFVAILLFSWLFSACMPAPHYQKEYAIPQNAWSYTFKPSFTFDITDSTAQYRPYFIIRHTQAYPYNNLWMWLYVKTPADSSAKKIRVNITLAEPNGKWLGRGMGEIYEQRMPIILGDSVNLSASGTYTVEMEQNMRLNPLPDVLHVGLRIEKIRPKQKN